MDTVWIKCKMMPTCRFLKCNIIQAKRKTNNQQSSNNRPVNMIDLTHHKSFVDVSTVALEGFKSGRSSAGPSVEVVRRWQIGSLPESDTAEVIRMSQKKFYQIS